MFLIPTGNKWKHQDVSDHCFIARLNLLQLDDWVLVPHGRSRTKQTATKIPICARVDQLLILKNIIPPLIENPYHEYLNPPYGIWVDEFIP